MTPNRNDSFVPLAPASPHPAGERREFRARVISQSSAAQSLQSVAAAVTPSVASPTAHVAHGEPKVTVQRDGNRVMGIHIQCTCGQVMELACVYDEAKPTSAVVEPSGDSGRREAGGPGQSATIPQPPVQEPEPGKICNDSGKDLPSSTAKKAKTTEKGSGTSAAKRRSA